MVAGKEQLHSVQVQDSYIPHESIHHLYLTCQASHMLVYPIALRALVTPASWGKNAILTAAANEELIARVSPHLCSEL